MLGEVVIHWSIDRLSNQDSLPAAVELFSRDAMYRFKEHVINDAPQEATLRIFAASGTNSEANDWSNVTRIIVST